MQKIIKVKPEVHKSLVKIKGKLEHESGELKSLNDVVVYLLKKEGEE
ncbi:hypothetical protein KAR91_28535 [Candidatus Pacearchaeota archaeon]|nr:hypothetical protein [Candidatus Pacearchaeota archaeon]